MTKTFSKILRFMDSSVIQIALHIKLRTTFDGSLTVSEAVLHFPFTADDKNYHIRSEEEFVKYC